MLNPDESDSYGDQLQSLLTVRYTKDIRSLCDQLDLETRGNKHILIDRIIEHAKTYEPINILFGLVLKLPCLKGRSDRIIYSESIMDIPDRIYPFLDCVCKEQNSESELVWCPSCGRILHVKCIFGNSNIKDEQHKWATTVFLIIDEPKYSIDNYEPISIEDYFIKRADDKNWLKPIWDSSPRNIKYDDIMYWRCPLAGSDPTNPNVQCKCYIAQCHECSMAGMDPCNPIVSLIDNTILSHQPLYRQLDPDLCDIDVKEPIELLGASMSESQKYDDSLYYGRPTMLWSSMIPSTIQTLDRLVINAKIKNAFFKLPEDWRVYRRAGCEIHLRAIKVKDCGGPLPVVNTWPRQLEYSINSHTNIIRAPEPHTPRRDRPIDITQLTTAGRNTVDLTIDIEALIIPEGKSNVRSTPRWYLAIVMVQPIDPSALGSFLVYNSLIANRLMKSLDCNVDYEQLHLYRSYYTELDPIYPNAKSFLTDWTKQYIYPKLRQQSDPDGELVVVSSIRPTVLYNRDPSSLSRIQIPVRGLFCQHVQVFDLMAFIEVSMKSSPRTNRWKCPICDSFVTFMDIRVDLFVARLFKKHPKTCMFHICIEEEELLIKEMDEHDTEAEISEDVVISCSAKQEVDIESPIYADERYGTEILVISDSD